jgi:hypothetical protein
MIIEAENGTQLFKIAAAEHDPLQIPERRRKGIFATPPPGKYNLNELSDFSRPPLTAEAEWVKGKELGSLLVVW